MNFTRETTFLFFRIVLPLAIFVIQSILYWRLNRWLREKKPQAGWMRFLAAVPFVLFNGALIAIFVLRPRTLDCPQWFMLFCAYPFFVWHGATFFIGLVLLIAHMLGLPIRALATLSRRIPSTRDRIKEFESTGTFRQFDASRRTFLRRSMYGLTAVSFAGNAYGLIHEKTSFEITRAQFSLPHLSPALDGFTITLVSDIHSSIFMTKPEMEKYVALINELGSELIVIPGDFVNGQTDEVYPFAEAFSKLQAHFGAYGVLGNHEYYAGNVEKIAQEVNACGIRLLRDEHATIGRNGAAFSLLGVDDIRTPKMATEKIGAAAHGSHPGIPRILLCHRPYFLPQASERNVQLMLSGHTHGGQVVLGHFGNTYIAPASLASQYVWGSYRYGATDMYVSRGIGTVGLPIRINCPPEITQITLRT